MVVGTELSGFVAPMLAVPGPLPTRPGWVAEVKWDGIRLVTAVGPGGVRCWTRSAREVSGTWPELTQVSVAGLAGRTGVFDGEIVALGVDGRPSFELLQQRMGLSAAADVARAVRDIPAVYMVFDVLALDGRDITATSWAHRRSLLDGLALAPWQVPAAHPDPAALLAFTGEQGLEGVVAKRIDSLYRPGVRSPAWVKVKHIATQEVVVGGWLPGKEGRTGDLGALLVGIPQRPVGDRAGDPVRLRFAGRVGTGWTAAVRRDLLARVRGLAADTSPFTGPVGAREAVWVRPELVGEVAHGGVTAAGVMRHPSWRGLRPDKAVTEVVAEG